MKADDGDRVPAAEPATPVAPPGEFLAVYAALGEQVQQAAERRSGDRVPLRDPVLAAAPPWAVPREHLMGLPAETFVENCYLTILDRVPRPHETTRQVALLEEGGLSRDQLVQQLFDGVEFARSGKSVTLR